MKKNYIYLCTIIAICKTNLILAENLETLNTTQIVENGGSYTNSGVISVKSGNAINGGEIEFINNSGMISGNSSEQILLGNAINSSSGNSSISSIIEVVDNSGTISGSGSGGRYNNFGYSLPVGNGISSFSNGRDSIVNSIVNSGIARGEGYNNSGTNLLIGNGVSSFSEGSNSSGIDKIINRGTISGSGNDNEISGSLTGNGIIASGNFNNITNIDNSGIIGGSGYNNVASDSLIGNGIGTYGKNYGNISNITNIGIIRGNECNNVTSNSVIGNGIMSKNDNWNNIDIIANNGVIKGSNNAIYLKGNYIKSGKINNSGIMSGQKIYNINDIESKDRINNKGIFVFLKTDGKIEKIENGTGGQSEDKKTIYNAEINNADSNFINSGSYTDSILNGAGISSGTLTYNVGTNSVDDSVVNGYGTALTVDNGAKITAENTIFNGGGGKVGLDINGLPTSVEADIVNYEDEYAVITMNNGEINVSGTSIINGNTEVSNGSIVKIDNAVQINGDLIATNGANHLFLGDGTTEEAEYDSINGWYNPAVQVKDNLRLFHKINGFTDIRIGGRVTAYETASISTGDINIGYGAELVIRVDGTKIDKNGGVIGHALYNHSGRIVAEDAPVGTTKETYEGPQLIFQANGLNNGTIIVLNGEEQNTRETNNETDISSLKDYQLGTIEYAYTATKLTNGNVELSYASVNDLFPDEVEGLTPGVTIPGTEEPSLPEEPEENYKDELGPIYESIVNSNQGGLLGGIYDGTIEEWRQAVAELTDKIYINNPYVQSVKLSKINIDLSRKSIFDTKMPEINKWIIEGHLISDREKISTKRDGYFSTAILDDRYNTRTYTYGLLTTGEYGIAKNTSIGFIFGGSHQKADMSYSTSLKGDSIYLGAYSKKKINDFTFLMGVGYQYGDFKGKRVEQYEFAKSIFQNEGKVEVDSYDIYAEAKYTFIDSNGRKIEPKLRLSEIFIKQNSVSEYSNDLAINMDKKNYNAPEVSGIIDFLQPIAVESGKLEAGFSLGMIQTLGNKENYVTSRMKDSTDFKIMGVSLKETKMLLAAKLDYEQPNGLLYNLGVEVNLSKNNNNNIKVKQDISTKLGIGYRF